MINIHTPDKIKVDDIIHVRKIRLKVMAIIRNQVSEVAAFQYRPHRYYELRIKRLNWYKNSPKLKIA
jgi:hypothetical protein